MRHFVIPFVCLAAFGCAETGTKTSAGYVAEAPLPEGWPTPGPYGQVVEKRYPAYRAAFTAGEGTMVPFFTLFDHIKKNRIPMTAPVEMEMDASGATLKQSSMAFLYQNRSVGTLGPASAKVEVRDVPGFRALTYAWQGSDSAKMIASARAELDAALAKSNRSAKEFRLLGYNGPDTPPARRTFELQAVVADR